MTIWDDLGLSGRRAIIVHQDDLGMMEAVNRAYIELGLPTGSIMFPGSWAPQLTHGDLGVHLTLTSEWTTLRMRPLTAGYSLRDHQGFFWQTVESAWMNVRLEEAVAEMRAQIDAAAHLGIDATHIDTHMGAVMRPDIAQAYHDLAVEYRLPCLLPERIDRGLPDFVRVPLEQLMEASPLPRTTLVDTYELGPQRAAWYADTLSQLGPGVYHLIHHAAVPTPEAQALSDWEKRNGDFEALRDATVRRVLDEFVLLTYRDVRDALRKYL